MSLNDEIALTESDAMRAPLDGLKRLCLFLGMNPDSNFERRSMVLWLVYTGHVAPSEETRRRMLAWA